MSSKKYTKNQLMQIAKKNNISLINKEKKIKTKEQLIRSLNQKKLLKGGAMTDECKNKIKDFLFKNYEKIISSIKKSNKNNNNNIEVPVDIRECCREEKKSDLFKLRRIQ